MKSTEPLNVAIIGTGILGGQHARYASHHPETHLAAVADSRSKVGGEIAEETGAVFYSDYRTMLRKEKLDLVIVATPDPLHRAPVVASARAGVSHIITEKPLATTLDDARRMIDEVRKADSRLYILFPNRFTLLDRGVHYAVQKGLLGKPVYGDFNLDDHICVPRAMWGRRSRSWAGGSSTAHFLLSHVVDLIRWYFHPAEISEVYAVSRSTVLKFTPDLYDAFLTLDTGLLIRTKAEWIRRMDSLVECDISISGDRGALVYRKIPAFRTRRGLRIDTDSAAGLNRHQKALARMGIRCKVVADPQARSPGLLEFHGEENQSEDEVALGHYFSCIRNNRETPKIEGFGPLPSEEDALRQVQVVSAIVKSAETGRSQKVR